MTTRWFVLDLNPEPWAVGPIQTGRSQGKLTSYMGRNQQLWNYQQAVKEKVLKYGMPEMMSGKFKLTLLFWRNQAEYKTPQARTHRKHEADLTNMVKALEDALQGVLYKNDKDTKETASYLVEQGPNVRGRILIGIEEAPDLPEILNNLPVDVYERLREDGDPSPTLFDGLDDKYAEAEVTF